jgi:hypothetical protein
LSACASLFLGNPLFRGKGLRFAAEPTQVFRMLNAIEVLAL